MPMSKGKKAAIGVGVLGIAGTGIVYLATRQPGNALGGVVVTPTSPPQGSTATVTASGMQPSEMVDVTMDGTILSSGMADTNGTASITIVIPVSTATGDHTIIATGRVSGKSSSTVISVSAWTSNAAINLAVAQVIRGNSVNFTVSGFAPSETIDFFLGTTDMGDLVADALGNDDGVLPVAATTTVGSHSVSATGRTSGRTASAALQVNDNPISNQTVDID